MTDTSSVKVAVRIRPQFTHDNYKTCTTVVPNEPQIYIGNDKAFTFDQVFNVETTQDLIYDNCVKGLVEGCFEGYNATVLAYGQTGSGKTYTMGTGFDVNIQSHQKGIVPRAIDHLFKEVENRRTGNSENGGCVPDIKINAQFIELYNEEIIDLLDPFDEKGQRKTIKIHENNSGGIYCVNLFVRCVNTAEEALDCLKTGSLSRTTASTQMNLQSSRSHAIFTIHIRQHRIAPVPSYAQSSCNSSQHEHKPNLNEFETLTAKFHFVDLAGSERLKRTKATGERQKEGISINSGLLALGNVISALGDKTRRMMHVPYRDSKLTRLLQDSLGGNSRTFMIACISPSDCDFMETLNTLTYANRAKKIKNKISVNMDKTSKTITSLRQEVESLKLELIDYKQGKRIIGKDGVECINDMYHENTMLQAENNSLKTRIKGLLETVDHLTTKNVNLLAEKETGRWLNSGEEGSELMEQMVKDYIKEVETLRAKLLEAEEVNHYLRTRHVNQTVRYSASPTSTVAITGQYDIRNDSSVCVSDLIVEAKENVKRLKKKKKKIKSSEKEAGENNNNNNNNSLSDEDKDVDEKIEDDVIMPDDSTSESEDQDDSAELAGLTCEISMKERLIRQLELQQYRMNHMQQRYEEKIMQLKKTILLTEQERDQFLHSLEKEAESVHTEKAQRVSADFERKLSALKKDVHKMQVAKKQHVHMMKNESSVDTELSKLKNELLEMKKAKSTLMNKIKEQAKKHKECEHKRNKEISLLKKDQRNKETRIKTLEAQKSMKEAVLRRKQEEIIALRRRNKHNRITTGRSQVSTASSYPRSRMFSPRQAKQKWQELEKEITKLTVNKQSIALVERDMNYYLLEREKIYELLRDVEQKLNEAKTEFKSVDFIHSLEDEKNSLIANLDYSHEKINECQSIINQLDTARTELDRIDVPELFKCLNSDELKYLMEKLIHMLIDQSFQALQNDNAVRELEYTLQQTIESNTVQEQLLMHLLHQQENENITTLIEKHSDNEEDFSDQEHLFIDRNLGFREQDTFVVDIPRKKKARETAATAEDILYAGNRNVDNGQFSENYNVLENFPLKMNEAMITGNSSENKGRRNTYICSSPYFPFSSGDASSYYFPKTPIENALMGEIKPFPETPQSASTLYLKCTNVVHGHKDGVVCIECTDDVLFSGSRDCTVKIWDLMTGKEIRQLISHPNTVTKVKYCEYTRLAFSVSMASIKIWDIRQKSACIQTLRSSGVTQKGCCPDDAGFKHVVPPGEYLIQDIALNHYGTTLFSAASHSIRMWDLKMYQSYGSLITDYNNPLISCLATDEIVEDENRIFSGMSDNKIRVYEVMERALGLHQSKYTLTHHQDVVKALAVHKDFLFSASTDMCLKKWDLTSMSVVTSMTTSTRDDKLTALNIIPSGNLILIGYNSGSLGLFSADTFELLEEIRAHSPTINAISSNCSSIFTASDDSVIGIWKLRAKDNNTH